MREKQNQIAFWIVAISCLILFFWYINQINAEATNNNVITATNAQETINSTDIATDTSDETEVDDETDPELSPELAAFYQKIKTTLTAATANQAGEIGITYLDLATNSKISSNGTLEFVGASTTKVPLVMLVSDKVAEGSLRWNQLLTYQESDFETGTGKIQNNLKDKYSVAQLAEVAITNSDNIAKNMLYTAIGGDKAGISEWYQDYLNKSSDGENIISSDDAAIILARLYQNQTTNAGYKTLLNNMSKTIYNDRLETATTRGKVAHKIGTNETYYHDIGIFFNDHPYVLTVYTNNVTDAKKFMSQLSDTIWNLTESDYPEN